MPDVTQPVDHTLRDRLAFARDIAVKAGKSTLEYFQTDRFEIEKKGDGSPLTIADKNAETLLRDEIGIRFPDDAIVGEEFDDKPGTSDFRWILDPIDGTKSFISGVPLYGTMVGVECADKPAIGVIYFPGLDEGAFAATGSGAWSFRGDQPPIQAHVSKNSTLADAVLVTSESETFDDRASGETWQQLAGAVYFTRTWGDAYGYYLVATGRVDVMIDPKLNIWDAAAVAPIIEEAGGKFTDWAGSSRIDAGESIGSNGHVHDAILKITSPRAGKFR